MHIYVPQLNYEIYQKNSGRTKPTWKKQNKEGRKKTSCPNNPLPPPLSLFLSLSLHARTHAEAVMRTLDS